MKAKSTPTAIVRSLASAGLLALTALPGTAQATTWDAAADFQTLSNPGGPWSYGYSPGTGTYSMRIFDNTSSGSVGPTTYSVWTMSDYISLGTPGIWKNTGANSYVGVAPGQLALHPGPISRGDMAIVRFSAPSAGRYDYTGLFGAGDLGDTSGSLVFNGDLLNPLVSFGTTAHSPAFSGFIDMMAGQTLDFVVGNNGDYGWDTTALSLTINSATVAAPVPEPETYAMLLAGLGLLGIARRRRSARLPAGVR